MHRSSDADIRAWGASTAVDSDEEDERQERFGAEVSEQRRLLGSGSTSHEHHSVGSAAWANALYQRRAARKGARDRRALLVVCCVLLGVGLGYGLARRRPPAASNPSPPAPQWRRVGSGPGAAARAEAQLQPEAAARSAASTQPALAPRLGPPPTIDPARWKHVLNESLPWAQTSVPAFECSDDDVTLTYWYRWRLFHLHMRRGDKLSACSSPRLGCWVRTLTLTLTLTLSLTLTLALFRNLALALARHTEPSRSACCRAAKGPTRSSSSSYAQSRLGLGLGLGLGLELWLG